TWSNVRTRNPCPCQPCRTVRSVVPRTADQYIRVCENIHQLRRRHPTYHSTRQTSPTAQKSSVFNVFRPIRGLTPFPTGTYTGLKKGPMRDFLRPTLAIAIAVAVLSSASSRLNAQPRERTLFVSAVDEKGEPVEGLGPDAFIVREDGRRREILRVSRATEPLDIALIVDNSQATADEISFIRDGVSRFIAAMGTEHRIALIGLAERPTALVQYTTDKAQLADGAKRL